MAKITAKLLTDTGSSSKDRITSIDTLTGTGKAGATITFTINGTVIGTTTANASGVWTFTPTGLGQGTHTVGVREPGASTSVTFTLDTVAPVVTEKLVSDTGSSSTDGITSNAALTGTGDANATVTLTEGTKVLGTTKANASGVWTFTPTGLAQGSNTIVATETDTAGNVGTTSLTFTLDSVKPVVTERLVSDTGSSSTDKITSNPALTGTGDANSVVTLKEGITVLGTTTANAAGVWTFTPVGLAQGANTIVASETDVAGNTGTVSLAFTLDTLAPAVTEKLVSDTGSSSTDGITNNDALTGTGDANAVVTLTEGAAVLGATTANASGVWNFTPAGLAQGANTIVASETDVAGNTGAASLTFTLDTVAPSVTESLVSVSGGSGSNTTSDPALQGGGDPNAVVTLTEGGVTLGTATAAATGAWTFTPVGLPQGANTIVASETDLAGNTGTASLSFTYATSGGSIINTSVAGPLVLNAATDIPLTITNTGAVTSTGAATDGVDGSTAAIWVISNAGTVTSSQGTGISLAGSGTITNAGLISGQYGVKLHDGGSLTNAFGGTIAGTGTAGTLNTGSGIYIAGATGAVANYGTITGNNHRGIFIKGGGSVMNAAGGYIGGVSEGVYFQSVAGTVTNAGSINATGTNGCGVYLEGSGSMTNTATGRVTGAKFGVFLENATGTLTNDGIIAANYDGVVFGLGGSVTNAVGASISGGQGVYIKYREPGTVTNSGTIIGTSSAAIDLGDGGTVTNNVGGVIMGAQDGVFVTKAGGTVVNDGTIAAVSYHGVDLVVGGSITNAAGAYIYGGSSGVYVGTGASGTITNAGLISASATSGAGADLEDGGSLTNETTGVIKGVADGVFMTGGASTTTNMGSISALDGVVFEAGGIITNDALASITGQSVGVFIQGGAGTLVNAGIISATASGSTGVDIEAGGSVANNRGGSISGSSFGVFLTGGASTITNAGSISSVNNVAIQLSAGGVVGNAAGGSISGPGFGVVIYGGAGTITNAGTISGGVSAARFYGSGANRLIVDPGAVFTGNVIGEAGTNTLELAAGTGTIGGISSTGTFQGFGTLAVDSGANWTLTGTDAVATVANAGTLAVAGSLDISAAIATTSSGLFLLDSAATLEVAAALGANTQMSFLSASELVVDSFASFGAGVGTAGYTGSLLENFGTLDSIDLKGFGVAGVAANFNSTSGLLQFANSAGQLATLNFNVASLGSGAFHEATDGGTGLLITHS
ncbi:MAG: Ig-like domain-containing protein [Devosia sp.]|nr:Ig-like domain-containing protein [Devosia sp.]